MIIENSGAWAGWVERYLDLLLQRDRQGAIALVNRLLAQGVDLRKLCLGLFQPSLREVGRLWQRDRITVAQEHYCTLLTARLMVAAQAHAARRAPDGRTLVMASPAGERHRLGGHMVSLFLEMEGWETHCLGADVPNADILHEVGESGADLLCLSATMPGGLSQVAEIVRQARAIDFGHPVVVLVGGRAFNGDPELWRKVGADGYAADARAAVAVAGGLVPPRGLAADGTLLRDSLEALREAETWRIERERLEAIGELSAGIAHTFNNILTSISLPTEIALTMHPLTAEGRRTLEGVQAQSAAAAALIQQLLDFSQKGVLRVRDIDLAALVQEQESALRQLLGPGIRLTISLQSRADYRVYGDGRRLQAVVLNLVQNAADAMPDGGRLAMTLSRGARQAICTVCSEPISGDWIALSFRDDGEGIDPDTLPRIFEPFFSTYSPLRNGLGLAQVLGIVKRHEGHIRVESEPGRGATISIFLRPADALEEG